MRFDLPFFIWNKDMDWYRTISTVSFELNINYENHKLSQNLLLF